ncbi:MAG: peptidoglycan-binding protein, partial [Pseudomonadota bacterium]
LAAIETRVAEVEKAEPASLVEAVASRVAERLEQAEARTTEALRDLGASFVVLDRRLKTVESGGGAHQRLEALAQDLTRRMEATRAELAQKLAASAEGRFDRMDRKLSEMASHIGAAETRSAEAIERMGREMVSMTDTLSRRVQVAENRSADAVEHIGGEVARIASAVEQKLGRADTVQAQALEKLGGEIARITERLAERIANSERRGALAIDEVGEQVARVTERINQRQERTATDLAERIRQSEERTARLLDEAREKIDASLNNVHRKSSEPVVAPVMSSARVPPTSDPFADPFAAEPFPAPGQALPEEVYAPQVYATQAFAKLPSEPEPGEPAPFPGEERGPPAFSAEDFDAVDSFTDAETDTDQDPDTVTETDIDTGSDAEIEETPDVPDVAEMPAAPVIMPLDIDDAPRPRSTREVIEQARLAARTAAQPDKAPSAEKRSLFRAREKKPKQRRAGSALQSAFIVAGGAAALAVGASGLVMINSGGDKPASDRIAEMLQINAQDARGEIKRNEADTTPDFGGRTPRVAMAIAPGVGPDGAATTTAPLAGAPLAAATSATPPVESGASLYAEGVRRIEAKDSTGIETLRRAANLGYAPAQFYLAKLYEAGEGGLRKDAGEARRWTERAAAGGDRKAMHNLGLYYFEGVGGGKNTTTAAQWFRKAADLGLPDSQYNLGRLYEEGYGVSQNGAEAYKWYLIAAKAGDGEARSSAERVKKDLSPEARAAAERSAGGYRASTPNASTRAPALAQAGGSATGVVAAQRALSMLGYYRGPQDGASSQALKGAIAAFQRDKRLPSTGNLDAETLSQLSPYAR